mmetsp:Transcript_28591/g.62193  ORF Transcript_28591/g.62193 Transcript_28591/m.62193 type:complete len:535 (-) Transcript_28591:355-1959(-)|eukprot:CAMPEP_0206566784 /NCGR_PEP_ID=MMETSP0325_2-20121206/24863_1 /ASSEMBLY_ACC=CAM_ASM_000347 /TAXON_ID=2866 /ORGANISM="Crypthecodinium cohnii, Strain Seligo" /LENGTH=534 /DNA_ID=CAMNT_0054069877 /DNA_START=44 /DNA_END=1648 /DNA_ORIENTATION=-
MSQQITINVALMSGASVAAITIERNASVATLKQEIAREARIPASEQRLVLEGELLSDPSALLSTFLEEVGAREEVDCLLVRIDRFVDEIKEDWKRLRKAPPALKDDPEVVKELIEKTRGEAFKFSGEALRSNLEVILAAMRLNASLLRYANSELQYDRNFLKEALTLLRNQGRHSQAALRIVWPPRQAELNDDREIVCLAVSVHGNALRHASARLTEDREVVELAMQNAPSSFTHSGQILRTDEEFCRFAVRSSPANLGLCCPEVRGDRQLVLELIRGGCWSSIGICSDELKKDEEVILAAVAQSDRALDSLPVDLRNKKPLIKTIAHINPEAMAYIGPELVTDGKFLLELLAIDQRCYRSFPIQSLVLLPVATEAVSQNIENARFAPGHVIRQLPEKLRKAIKENPDLSPLPRFRARGMAGRGGVGAGTYDPQTSPYSASAQKLENMERDDLLRLLRKDMSRFKEIPMKLQKDKAFVKALIEPSLDPVAKRGLNRLSVGAMVARYVEKSLAAQKDGDEDKEEEENEKSSRKRV